MFAPSFTGSKQCFGSFFFTHLDEGPVRLDDLDDHHHRDADHGGQSQSPADPDGPVRILIDLVVSQRLVLDQGEDEAALRTNTQSNTQPSCH